jgi:molybdenum cofactor guanylyltransferase
VRIAGCILAGGKSSRMGVNKGSALLAGRPLLDHAIERLGPQVDTIVINSNTSVSTQDYLVVVDQIQNFAGPLAGILAGLFWAKSLSPKVDALVTIPVDAPFFPLDLVAKLGERPQSLVTVASYNGQLHPIFALWPIGIENDLRAWLENENNRSVKRFISSIPHRVIEFPTLDKFDPFTNINTPEELAAAEIHVQKL